MAQREDWNHSQACDACRAANAEAKSCNHFRGGKTKREHVSGVWAQRMSNQQIRANWDNETPGRRSKFPAHACNGHRNRFASA